MTSATTSPRKFPRFNIQSQRVDRLIFLALALICVSSQWPSFFRLFAGQMPFTHDATALFGPWRIFARDVLTDGRLPFWNPHLFCGQPFLANNQTAIFYPPNVVYWLLSLPVALMADGLLHQIFLAWGGYVLARVLGLGRAASVLCALCLGLGNSVAGHLGAGHMTWNAARSYIPWQLAAMRLWTLKRRHAELAAVALFALQIASGYSPLVLLSAALCGGLVVAVSLKRRRLAVPLSSAIFSSVLLSSLAAVWLLPMMEVSAWSEHGSGLKLEEAMRLPATWKSFARLFLPDFFGGSSWMQWSLARPKGHEEGAAIGLAPLLLALAAPWLARHQHRQAAWWLWALLPVAAIFSLGDATPVLPWLYNHVGLFQRIRIPVRWLEVWFLVSAVLAAIAFDGCLHHAAQSSAARFWKVLTTVFAAVGGVCLLIAAVTLLQPPDSTGWQALAKSASANGELPATEIAVHLQKIAWQAALFAALFAAVAAILSATKPRFSHRFFVLLWLCALAVENGVLFGTVLWQQSQTAWTAPETWPQSLVSRYEPNQRWTTLVRAVDAGTLNDSLAHGIDSFNGYDALSLKPFFEFSNFSDGQSGWADFYQPARYSPLLRVAGVTHCLATVPMVNTPAWPPDAGFGDAAEMVAQDGDHTLWRYADAWPRVYLTRNLQSAEREKQLPLLSYAARKATAVSRLPVVVKPGAFAEIFSDNSALPSNDSVTKWQRTPNMLTVQLSATKPSVLVVGEAFSPAWRAAVNEKLQTVEQANYLFQGVAVPAGNSEVRLVFDSQTYRCALFISLVALAFFSGIVLQRRGQESHE